MSVQVGSEYADVKELPPFILSRRTVKLCLFIKLAIVNDKRNSHFMESQRNTHHVYRLMYHFVWIPKYRHKVFDESYREVLKGIIEKIDYDYGIDIVELEIPEDHIHMVVRGVPKIHQVMLCR